MKTVILLIVGSIIFVACDLTEEPYGFYSEDNFLKTPDDFDSGIGYAYDALTYLEYARTVFYLGDLPSDEVSPKPDQGGGAQELNRWDTSNFSTNPSLVNFFKYAYIAINRSNIIIDKIQEADFDQELKDQYLGEAYFLRAWNYFNLVRNFGTIPIHTSNVSTLNQTNAPMAANLDEVYDLILSDVKNASDLLKIGQRTGRADKVAAQSLAAKAYLFIASAKENNVPLYTEMGRNVEQMYDSAAYYAGEVVYNQNSYGFDPDLLSIYDVENPKGPEHIFLMSMDRTGLIEGDYSKISKTFLPYIAGGDIYIDNKDGSYTKSHDGWSVMKTRDSFYDTFEDNDKRATLLMVDSVYNQNGELIANYPDDFDYRFTRKYVDPKFIGDKTSTKPYLLRFSDIALVYAEAVGPTSEAYDLINYIRERAGIEPLAAGLNTSDFRQAVLRERGWEMAFEGNRLSDLRRFNLVTSLVDQAAGLTEEEAAFFPIPQVEIDLNPAL